MRTNESSCTTLTSNKHANRYSHTNWRANRPPVLQQLPPDVSTGTLVSIGVSIGLPVLQKVPTVMPIGLPRLVKVAVT